MPCHMWCGLQGRYGAWCFNWADLTDRMLGAAGFRKSTKVGHTKLTLVDVLTQQAPTNTSPQYVALFLFINQNM